MRAPSCLVAGAGFIYRRFIVKTNFVVNAEARKAQGTGASRRLRHAGKVPAILYGGKDAAEAITLDHNELWNHLKTEAFY